MTQLLNLGSRCSCPHLSSTHKRPRQHLQYQLSCHDRPICRSSTSSSGSPTAGSSSNGPNRQQEQQQQQQEQQQQQQQRQQQEPLPEQDKQPWQLMGRVVQSERLVLGAAPRQRLALLAAAQQLDISPQAMEQRLLELVTLLPDLSSLLPSLNPATMAGLARDTQAVASRLIQLRLLFPSADVSQMISRRPTLLLDEEFAQVETARTKLLARLAPTPTAAPGAAAAAFPPSADIPTTPNILGTTHHTTHQASSSSSSSSSSSTAAAPLLPSSPVLDGLVSRQPLLLVSNVDELLDELERLLPAVDVMPALLHDPDLVTQIMCNRGLSLWLMPGVAVLQLLQNNPDLLYMVQRGTQWLGPGAEFMGPG